MITKDKQAASYGVELFSCYDCGKSYSPEELDIESEEVVPSERRFNCPACRESYTQVELEEIEERSRHAGTIIV